MGLYAESPSEPTSCQCRGSLKDLRLDGATPPDESRSCLPTILLSVNGIIAQFYANLVCASPLKRSLKNRQPSNKALRDPDFNSIKETLSESYYPGVEKAPDRFQQCSE